MTTNDRLDDAQRRSRALARLQALGTLPPESVERIVRLASHVGGDGFSAGLHLLDEHWQHRVAGSDAPRIREDVANSFCIAVVQDRQTLYTEDAGDEPRLAHSTQARGPERIRTYWGAPLRLEGAPVGTLCVWHADARPLDDAQRARLADLAQLAGDHLDLLALGRELGHDATHDPLTGLAHRTLLSERISAALARADRGRGRPTLLLVDLDRFKSVNDRYGHVVGDEVLVSTARRLSGVVRQEDLVARLGGDEFAVLVEAADSGTLDVLRRLQGLAEQPHATSAGEIVCGFTLGVAEARPDDLPYELLGRADADLYLRKLPGPRA